MARKHELRVQRAGTVINSTAKAEETGLLEALTRVVEHIVKNSPNE
jgi:hypothetical protein